MTRLPGLLLLSLTLCACAEARASGIRATDALEARLAAIAARSDGRVGVCAADPNGAVACVNGDQRFSMQSVMKLIVGAAVMDAVDRRGWRLDDEVVIRRADLSLHVQPLADIVREKGEFRTTVGDLVERAVTRSDSAATDVLFARLGGAPAIAEFLRRNGAAEGIRVDRDERHLQTEASGVSWRPEFVDPEELEHARAALSESEKAAAFAAYLADARDTATPRGMASFLQRLARGSVLSPASTEHFLGVMERTRTFPDRLRAGAPAGWRVAHKTGTSADWKGQNGVTNDVGLLVAPDGGMIAVAAFVAESRRPDDARAAVIADSARAVVESYR
jgi:beta-lactamase class A